MTEHNIDAPVDVTEITLNLTDDDLTAGTEFKLIPPNTWVTATIYMATPTRVKNGDNAGKPQYHLTFRLVEHTYGKNKQLQSWVPLYSGALFSYINLLRALGDDIKSGQTQLSVISPEDLQGQEIDVLVKSHRTGTNGSAIFENVGGFAPPRTKADGASSGTASGLDEFASSGSGANLFE